MTHYTGISIGTKSYGPEHAPIIAQAIRSLQGTPPPRPARAPTRAHGHSARPARAWRRSPARLPQRPESVPSSGPRARSRESHVPAAAAPAVPAGPVTVAPLAVPPRAPRDCADLRVARVDDIIAGRMEKQALQSLQIICDALEVRKTRAAERRTI